MKVHEDFIHDNFPPKSPRNFNCLMRPVIDITASEEAQHFYVVFQRMSRVQQNEFLCAIDRIMYETGDSEMSDAFAEVATRHMDTYGNHIQAEKDVAESSKAAWRKLIERPSLFARIAMRVSAATCSRFGIPHEWAGKVDGADQRPIGVTTEESYQENMKRAKAASEANLFDLGIDEQVVAVIGTFEDFASKIIPDGLKDEIIWKAVRDMYDKDFKFYKEFIMANTPKTNSANMEGQARPNDDEFTSPFSASSESRKQHMALQQQLLDLEAMLNDLYDVTKNVRDHTMGTDEGQLAISESSTPIGGVLGSAAIQVRSSVMRLKRIVHQVKAAV